MLQRGQKIKLQDLNISTNGQIEFILNSSLTIDFSCFGVTADNKLKDDRYMVFYNVTSSPNQEIKLIQQNPNHIFTFDLNKLPDFIEKMAFTATLDGSQTMNQLGSLKVKIGTEEFNLQSSDFQAEKAIIVTEIYKKDGIWRLSCVGQGFNGGLESLLNHYGGQAASNTNTPVIQNTPTPKISLEKKVFLEKRVSLEKQLAQNSPGLLSLTKKAAVSLEKRGLGEHKAKVALCLDISVSMDSAYKSGIIQQFAEKILALGCRMDDDGSIDVFLFGERGSQPPSLSVQDFPGYIQRMLQKNPLQYDTRYSDAIEMVRRFYTPYQYERSEPLKLQYPIYVMFLTDGKPSDKAPTTKAIKNASYEPIFWQFMGLKTGIGSDFSYLEKLDDLDNRYLDNADFFSVSNLNAMSDEELYNKLTNEYPKWVEQVKVKNMIDTSF